VKVTAPSSDAVDRVRNADLAFPVLVDVGEYAFLLKVFAPTSGYSPSSPGPNPSSRGEDRRRKVLLEKSLNGAGSPTRRSARFGAVVRPVEHVRHAVRVAQTVIDLKLYLFVFSIVLLPSDT